MSYTKMSKKFPNEAVEEKNTKNKSVMKGCPSLDLNQSLEEMDLQLNSFSNSTDATKLKPPKASEPLYVVRKEEPEYGCNFCPKKFSNKQALGGHQNAHKIEKVGQKRARQGQEATFGYPGNGINSFPFPNSFDQVPKMIKSAHYPQYMEHQVHAYEYPGSIFPTSHESGVAQPFIGFAGFCTIPKQPPKPQMHASDYPSSMFPMSHEYGVPRPFMELGSIGKSMENPAFVSFGRRAGLMGQGTSKGRSTAVAKNDEADHHRHINNTEIQHPEDDLDLSLKL